MNINSRTSKINFTGFKSGAIASFTGLRVAPTKVKVNAIGVSECNVVWCGKNLFDKTTATFDSGSYDADGNVISNPSLKHISNYLIVKGNTDYTLSGTIYVSSVAIRVFYFDANKNWISRSNAYTSNSVSFTTPANCCYIQFQCAKSISSLDDWQIELGSTATAYEAYTSTSYIIPVGQTVTQIDQRIGVNNIFVDDENVAAGNVEVYYVTI